MRLLHPRAGDGGARSARPPGRTDRAGDPRGHQRQPLSLHGLRPGDGGRPGHDPPARGRHMSDTTTTRDAAATRSRPRAPGLGVDAPRPDGIPKVQGRFGYSSDLFAEDMLWGHTLRSPHPHARITAIDLGPALRIGGVYAVLTADDVPGAPTYGLETP